MHILEEVKPGYVWLGCSKMALYTLRRYAWFGLDQLLITGQISHCTDEGGATVYQIASHLVVGVSTHLTLAINR